MHYTRIRAVLVALGLIAGIGCTKTVPRQQDEPRKQDEPRQQDERRGAEQDPVVLDSLPGGDAMVATEYSLCDLVQRSTLIGKYQVERIESNIGSDLDDPSDTTPLPVSEVTLDGVAWTGTDPSPKIKLQGGTTTEGTIIAAEVGFEAGEEVIVFLGHQWPDQTWRVEEQRVLRKQADGTLAGELLFGRGDYTAPDIRILVNDASDGICEKDVLPDSKLDAADAGVGEDAADEDEHIVYPADEDMGHLDEDVGGY